MTPKPTAESAPASRPRKGTGLVLMDSGIHLQPKIEALVLANGGSDLFELPVWVDFSGMIRIALPKKDPTHSADCDQVVVSLQSLLAAVSQALPPSLAVAESEGLSPEVGSSVRGGA